MARSGSATIKISGPPPYTVAFTGSSANRVHPRGHLWLRGDAPGFVASFQIVTQDYLFDDGSGDAAGPLYTGGDPNPDNFDPVGQVFTKVTLSPDRRTLSFTISNNDSQKYYYQLNFVDTKHHRSFSTVDPIVVNN